MIECVLLNRLRGTGVLKHFGTLRVDEMKIWKLTIPKIKFEIKLVWNHVYGLYSALVFGLLAMNVWAGLAVLVAYFIGEAKGWGEWVGSLTKHKPWDEAMLEFNYADTEGKTFPFIHQISNFIIPEKIEGTFEQRARQYKHYAILALALRGFYWWSFVYFTLAIFQVIQYQEALIISILLGVAFPIACEIGKRISFTKTYNLMFIKLNFKQGWENQEIVYGLFQGIALWYTIIFLT